MVRSNGLSSVAEVHQHLKPGKYHLHVGNNIACPTGHSVALKKRKWNVALSKPDVVSGGQADNFNALARCGTPSTVPATSNCMESASLHCDFW